MFGTKPAAASGYLLDTYTGAAAAYSLRQLKTGVTSVVRVRRSSDNAEADFTALEITNGTLTTWTGANNGFVVTLYDQSGNNNNATQTVTGSQPAIVLAGVLQLWKAKPTLLTQVTGTQRWLTTSFTSAGGGVSTAVVGSLVSGGVNRGAGLYIASIITQAANTFNYGGASSTFYTNGSYDCLMTTHSSGTTGTIRNNGADIRDTAKPQNTLASVTNPIILSRNSSSLGGSFLVSEVIIWNGDKASVISEIEADINTYYGIY